MIAHGGYYIEQIGADCWQEFKEIRLESLRSDPSVFGTTYEKDAALTEEDWVRGLRNPLRATFLLRHRGEVVGLTVIRCTQEMPEEAGIFASYIRKEHRGQGLSRLFYEARLNWARTNGVKRIVTDHRKGNTASETTIKKYGFKKTHSEMQTWPDGSKDEKIYYRLDL